MSSNAYLTRLEQLKADKAQTVAQQAASIGLPRQSPRNPAEQGNKMLGVPPKQEEPQPANMFERNIENFRGQDVRFGEMMDEYTNLALGLREQVNSGYMPEIIAKKKLESYLEDSSQYFKTHAMKPTDNPEVRGMLEGIMAQSGGQAPQGGPAQQGGAPMPPQGAPQPGGM